MLQLLTTVEGRYGTLRSIRWGPMLVTPIVSSVVLVVMRAAAGPTYAAAILGEAGLAFTAMAAAFIVDDAVLEAAPATPLEVAARLAARGVVALPVVVLGWLGVVAVYGVASVDPTGPGLARRALPAAGLATLAIALSTVAGRRRPVISAGAAGMGSMACVAGASMALPVATMTSLPSGTMFWPPTILMAVATIVLATREPIRY